MKQILQNLRTGKTGLSEFPCPQVATGQVLIQTHASLISAGTERMLVEFGRADLLAKAKSQPEKVKQILDKIKTDGLMPTLEAVFRKLDEPLPLGYCNVGVVVNAEGGTWNEGLRTGERVVSNGPHAEVVSVPERLCAKVPDAVSDEEATFAVLASVGLQGIKLANPSAGERVVVYGLGLIGLLAVQILRARGCEVFGVDLDFCRLKLAEQFGATVFDASGSLDPVPAVLGWADNVGAHAVLITASAKKDDIVHKSTQMCRKRGRIVLVGVVDLNLRRSDFYEKELSFQVSCSYGPDRHKMLNEEEPAPWTVRNNLKTVLGLMAEGQLNVKPLITHRFDFNDAQEAYRLIREDRTALGVILKYNGHIDRSPKIEVDSPKENGGCREPQTPVLAVIGAGNFAKATLLPALRKTSVRIKYIASQRGASAAHVARKFCCENAVSDYRIILEDKEVNTVVIAVQHNLHSRMVCEALKAGKHVFVEKPLCLTEKELETISAMYQSQITNHKSQILMVGFNRRFSPHTKKVKELIANRHGSLCMTITVNAGEIPHDHWAQDPNRGGGRIVGEACHFIDLLSHIAGSPVVTVSATMVGKGPVIRDDKMAIVLSFADGSVGTVNYFANGTKSYPKETLEVFSDGRILRVENFRKTSGFGFSGFRRSRTFRQDKGHAVELATFVDLVEAGGDSPIPFDQLENVVRASFAAVTSARENRVVRL